MDSTSLEGVHVKLAELLEIPDTFLSVNKKGCEQIKQSLKVFYDHVKSVEVEKCRKNSVPQLFLNGMDEEALWQQLELQNNFTLDKLVEKSASYMAMKYDSLKFDYHIEGETEEEDDDEDDDGAEQSDVEEGEEENGGWEDLQNEEDEGHSEVDQEDDEEEEGDGDDNLDEDINEEKINDELAADSDEDDGNIKKRKKKVDLDDDFFKLKELNKFLDEEDRKEMSKGKKKHGDDEDVDGIDLFQDLDEDDEDEDGAADMKYADFFEKPGASQKNKRDQFRGDFDDEEGDEEDEEDNNGRRVKFDLDQNEEFSDKEGENAEEDELDPDDPKSSNEERQERLRKKIERMEQKSISEKPWQLKGEVKGTSRPENSLLEEYLEFDSSTRPAPLITEETTKRLDDIILQRIKDRAFDDVERKVRPSDNNTEFRKQLILDQTKSKESLAQIYEKDYMDKVEAQKEKSDNVLEEESVVKKEIRENMRQLMAKLDALSNYHFTPKPAAPDIRIITNTPAIEMEEAAPVAVSDATMLAPEEVKRPNKGDIIGRTERTKTDKNRERRRKKMKQRLSSSKETESGKMDKATLEKVTKARNVEKMKEVGTGRELKSSKEFFSKLQEEVGKKKDDKKRRKVRDENVSAKKVKL